MLTAPILADEAGRLAVVRNFDILDTPSEAEFDDLAELASMICGTPVALMTVLDEHRQWFKSRVGFDPVETAREISFCSHAIAQDGLFEVPDAQLDARFADNPLVNGDKPVRFYAGAPLVAQGGFRLGTLCVIDHVPRQLDAEQKQALTTLARLVVRQMENRAIARELAVKSRFRDAVIDSTDVAILAIDVDGIITGFNRGAENLLGYAAADVVGKASPMLFHDAEEVAARARALSAETGTCIEPGLPTILHLAGREVHRAAAADAADAADRVDAADASHASREPEEWTFISRDGQRIPVQISLSPIRGADGALFGCLAIAQNITERKRAFVALEQNQRFLQTLIDMLPVALYTKSFRQDEAGRLTLWNKASEAITGYPASLVAGKTNREIFPLEMALQHEAHDAQILATRAPVEVPMYRIQRPDGQSRLLRTVSVPMFDADGALEHVLGVSEDISDTTLQNRELKRKQAELLAVSDASPLGMFRTDAKRRVTYVNRTYETITGLSAEQALGEGWVAGLHPEDRAPILAARKAAATDNAGYVNTQRFVRPDGSVAVCRVMASPILVDGVFNGFVGTVEDITERRRITDALSQSEQSLRLITNSIPALVAHVDARQRYLFVNPQMAHAFNKKPEAMVGRTLQQEHSSAMYAWLKPYIDCALRGETVTFEGRDPAFGAERYFRTTYVPERNAQGEVAGFYSMTFDITETKLNELAQAAAERRLRTITDNLPVLITYIDQERYLRFANATIGDWMGLSPAEAIDRPFADVLGPDVYAQRREFMDRALAGERVEFEVSTEIGGLTRHMQAVYLPDRNADGTVQGFYTLTFDVSKLKASEQRLLQLARVDSLTGLANRGQLNEKLDEAVARHQRSRQPMAVMYLDIDRFKQINDSLGHAAGDQVLIEFAKRLDGAIRATDIVARLSGDEFVVVLENLHSEQEAAAVASKILTAMQPEFVCNGFRRAVSVSIGIAYAPPASGLALAESAGALLARADKALYAAKAKGRKTFAVA